MNGTTTNNGQQCSKNIPQSITIIPKTDDPDHSKSDIVDTTTINGAIVVANEFSLSIDNNTNNISNPIDNVGNDNIVVAHHVTVVHQQNEGNNNEQQQQQQQSSHFDERSDLPPSRDFVYPKFDPALYKDDRVLANLLKLEERSSCQISCKYFKCVQIEVQEHMRRTLTEWMLEVSEEERCDCEVFPLAVSYVDRFLSIEAVHKSQLQVLGTACLFIASKIKQPQPLCAKRLVDYSAQSISLNELMSWELLVLNRLRWDLVTVTAGDILEHLLYRLHLPLNLEQKLRPQLHVYAALIATEYKFAILPPSIVAVCCLCVAFCRLMADPEASSRMLFALQPILKVDMCIYEPYVDAFHRHLIETVYPNSASTNNPNYNNNHNNNNSGKIIIDRQRNHNNDHRSVSKFDSDSDTGGTPTDIRDVDFSS